MTSDEWNATSVLLILPDNTALRFAATREKKPVTICSRPRRSDVGAFVRSFFPHVAKIHPRPTVLPSGKTVALMSA